MDAFLVLVGPALVFLLLFAMDKDQGPRRAASRRRLLLATAATGLAAATPECLNGLLAAYKKAVESKSITELPFPRTNCCFWLSSMRIDFIQEPA